MLWLFEESTDDPVHELPSWNMPGHATILRSHRKRHGPALRDARVQRLRGGAAVRQGRGR